MPSPSWLKRMKHMVSRDNVHTTSPTSPGSPTHNGNPTTANGTVPAATSSPFNGVPAIEITEPSKGNLYLALDAHDPNAVDKDLPAVPLSAKSFNSGFGSEVQSQLSASPPPSPLPHATSTFAPTLPSLSFEKRHSEFAIPLAGAEQFQRQGPSVQQSQEAKSDAAVTAVSLVALPSAALPQTSSAVAGQSDQSTLVANAKSLGNTLSVTVPPPRTISKSNGSPVSTSGLSQVWETVKENKDVTVKSVKIIEQAVGGVDAITSAVNEVESVAGEVSSNLAGTALASGIQAFVDNIPLFMKGLDELAKIHPFIGVAVIAFKAVYIVGEKYVENDRNVKALRDEMKSLMEVLLRLRGLKKEQVMGPDGSTVDARLHSLIQQTVSDIRTCGNTIETYQQQRVIVKIALSVSWSARFSSLAANFTTRRGEFEQELVIHTAVSVDGIDAKVTDMKESLERVTRETSERMIKMFEERMTANQRQLLSYMQDKGGVKAFQNEATVKILIEQRPSWAEPEMKLDGGRPRRNKGAVDDGDDPAKKVLDDLKTSITVAEEKNMERFSQRLQIRMDRLETDMKEEFARQSDRIIGAINDGAYQRIKDEDVRAIWKDMQWRGNVKARYFILALKDYYYEQMERARDQGGSHDPTDDWTVPYINVPYLQPVLEAFDDDASGFITISEVNNFIRMRPEGWSLRHWIAYWAVGWFKSISEQAKEIDSIFAKMFGLLPRILATNTFGAACYLETIWLQVYQIIHPIKSRDAAPELPYDKFSTYVDQEQQRLEANLKKVNYVIDREEMVFDITGKGRIEKYYMPLVLLLLRKHLETLQVACEKALPEAELSSAAESILFVGNAIFDRYQDLQVTFTQQRYDLKQQFRSFAYGFFRYIYEPNDLWSGTTVKQMEFDEEAPTVDTKMAIDVEAMLDFALEDEQRPTQTVESVAAAVTEPVPPESASNDASHGLIGQLSGTWYCSVLFDPTAATRETFMRKMNIAADPSSGNENKFVSSAISYSGQRFVVSGSCVGTGDTGSTKVIFTVTYESDIGALSHYAGEYDPERQVITGTCGFEEDPSTHKGTFTMTRSNELLRFWPTPAALKNNRWQALWQFAIAVARSKVRNRSSWTFIKGRQQFSKKWTDWQVRRDVSLEKLTEDDERAYEHWGRQLAFRDLCMFTFRRWTRNSFELEEPELQACDNCGTTCTLSRVTCLECESSDDVFSGTLDLCGEDPVCQKATVDVKSRSDLLRPHLPTHDVMKLRRMVLERQYPAVYRLAQAALTDAKAKVKSLATPPKPLAVPTAAAAGGGSLDAPKESKRLSKVPLSQDSPAPALQCSKCKQTLTLPCWYCAECTDGVFICSACDAQGAVQLGDHSKTHILVKCQAARGETAVSMEKEVTNLKQNMQVMMESMQAVREHLKTVSERSEHLEELLKGFLTQSASAGST